MIGQTAKLDGQWLHIQKIGYVRLTGDNPYPDGIAKSGTVKEENGKWYAYIVYAVEAGESLTADDAVGIDRNVGQIALSDGTIYRAPDVEKKERRRKRYQRMMARRQKPVRKKGIKASGRYQKARRLAGRTSQKIKHINDNWTHQVSREIADQYSTVYMEDLKTKNMTKSAKGTLQEPGTNVAQKSGLNRSILQTGWYKLEQALAYKRRFTRWRRITPVSGAIAVEQQTERTARRNLSSGAWVAVIWTMQTLTQQRTYSPWGIGESLNGRGEGQSSSEKRQESLDSTLDIALRN